MRPAIKPEWSVELFEIAMQMKQAGLADKFITEAVNTAQEFEGVYDLMVMWRDESDPKERDEVVADIQDMIDDTAQRERSEAVYVQFNDLEAIARDIRKFKDALLLLVNQRGSVTQLAEMTGIPQPSLSRFFNTNSMPRRVTLLKIAKALDLDAVQIASGWTRG